MQEKNFGPFADGFIRVAYNDKEALEEALRMNNVVGVLIEPIQGEAGVNVPSEDFIKNVAELCKQYNTLYG